MVILLPLLKQKKENLEEDKPYLFAIILLFIGIAFLAFLIFFIQDIKERRNEKLETEAIINITSIERA